MARLFWDLSALFKRRESETPASDPPTDTGEQVLKNPNDSPAMNDDADICNHPALMMFDPGIVNVIVDEIVVVSPQVKWTDICGLEFVKRAVQETVIWPLLRPDIFTGILAPDRGILLFGPPGTGKTMIGKCIATESKSKFFNVTAASLTSKFAGQSEKLIKCLFAVANLSKPAVVFIDEIDSIMSKRNDMDVDHVTKQKTEFLAQFDGMKTSAESSVIVIGATNRPDKIDEAALRRFGKRLYVPLPDESARCQIIRKMLSASEDNLSEDDFRRLGNETEGYSASDMTQLCREAAMGRLRCIGDVNIETVAVETLPPILLKDFLHALKQVRASVSQDALHSYLEWNKRFGSLGQEL